MDETGKGRSLRKKSFFKSRRTIGLPFPNFGLGSTELPTICRCYCSFEDDTVPGLLDGTTCPSSSSTETAQVDRLSTGIKDELNNQTSTRPKCSFFVVHQIDILTLYINGSFGTSSLTHRGPSFLSDSPFQEQQYYKKLKQRQQFFSTTLEVPNKLVTDSATSTLDQHENTNDNNMLDTVNQEEEKLLLLPEEVIFLSFGVGCLSLLSSTNGENLSYQNVWKQLVKRNQDFPYLYAVYHYFRAKNWVPKSGVQFGGDYVLYKLGPESHHSAYIVHIIGIPSRPKPSWTEIYSWQRVAAGGVKQAVLCEVTPPKTFVPENTTPRCIFDIKIFETVIERWLPGKS